MTSVIGLACQPVLLMKMGENGGNIALVVASGAFLSFFTFATPMLIHWVSKKYVVELVLALYSFFFVICFATISWCACLLQICGKGQVPTYT